ncbi:MAG: hypothetical protein M4579_003636 [Chaenotheca gracillima]|nr:MAG: hypothetical protein M4579_003636 [Chaenotheca gracillima]
MGTENDADLARRLQEQFNREDRLRHLPLGSHPTGAPTHQPAAVVDNMAFPTLTRHNAELGQTAGNGPPSGIGPANTLSAAEAGRELTELTERLGNHVAILESSNRSNNLTGLELARHIRRRERRRAIIRADLNRRLGRDESESGDDSETEGWDEVLYNGSNSSALPSLIDANGDVVRNMPPAPDRRHFVRVNDFDDIVVQRSARLRECMLAILRISTLDSDVQTRHSPDEIVRIFHNLPPQEAVRFAYFLRDHQYDTHIYFEHGRDHLWRLCIRVQFEGSAKTYVVPMNAHLGHAQNTEGPDQPVYRPELSGVGGRVLDLVPRAFRDRVRGALGEVWW